MWTFHGGPYVRNLIDYKKIVLDYAVKLLGIVF